MMLSTLTMQTQSAKSVASKASRARFPRPIGNPSGTSAAAAGLSVTESPNGYTAFVVVIVIGLLVWWLVARRRRQVNSAV